MTETPVGSAVQMGGSSPLPSTPEVRIAGIDALKIVSILMVSVLHILGQGGILSAASGIQSQVVWAMEAACYCAVNSFAIASGYVQSTRSAPTLRQIFTLWLQVVCLTCGITLAFKLLGQAVFNPLTIRKCLLPVLSGDYWYFTAYFVLCFFLPLLNRACAALSIRELRQLAAVIFGLACAGRITGFFGAMDFYRLNGGYSVLWLLLLYVIGAWLRRDRSVLRRIPAWGILLLYVVAVVVARLEHLAGIGLHLLRYDSPAILLSATALVELFSRLNVSSSRIRTGLRWIAALTFGAYIVQCHWLVWGWLKGRFVDLATLSPVALFAVVLVAAGGLFTVCATVDFLRKVCFSLVLRFSPSRTATKKHPIPSVVQNKPNPS